MDAAPNHGASRPLPATAVSASVFHLQEWPSSNLSLLKSKSGVTQAERGAAAEGRGVIAGSWPGCDCFNCPIGRRRR